MRFKITKEELINRMASKARYSSHHEIRSLLCQQGFISSYSMADMIAQAVSSGIELGIIEAMTELFEQEYTDDDFERDLNLK